METMSYAPFLTCFNAFHLPYLSPPTGDMGYAMGRRSESPKELPSRINRQRRSVERREGPLVMKCDGDHNHKATSTATTSTRCASTQTLITSEMVGIPEINPDLPIPSSSSLISQDNLLKRPSAIPPPPPHPSHRHRNMPPQLLRPSVITCAPAPLLREPNRTDPGPVAMGPGAGAGLGPVPYLNGRASSTERWSSRMPQNHLPSQPQNADIDPDIEEHFRRSLGQNYRETYSSPPPMATSPPKATSPTLRQSSSSPKEVNITGSVDDHFAKALGDKWSQIKDVIEPVSDRTSPSVSPSLAMSSSPVVQHQQASVAS
ncbi:transcription cofactor vestigial-like protein 4 isoform X1 [Lytechinus variegatus]|uniref:transcription cofactor vestigial-like protein 4 isoform X1 n=1 Tax=Lytechinus variegatus TaxID=7654 RepID=UPI001BB18036|nr:transcription cofactor vestigial-like protein 4 isoform X1 [Lytechinus variegatus]